MDHWFLDIFVREVERQAAFGVMASQDLAGALSAGNMDRLWYSTQALLIAAGNVSKLLWPGKPLSRERGQQLRAVLGVSDESALRPRAFRNHFEHYDDRLEKWIMSSERHNIVDSSVLPAGAIQGIDPGDFLRNLDPTSMKLTFRGDSYDLGALVGAIRDLRNRAEARMNAPPWTRDPAASSDDANQT